MEPLLSSIMTISVKFFFIVCSSLSILILRPERKVMVACRATSLKCFLIEFEQQRIDLKDVIDVILQAVYDDQIKYHGG